MHQLRAQTVTYFHGMDGINSISLGRLYLTTQAIRVAFMKIPPYLPQMAPTSTPNSVNPPLNSVSRIKSSTGRLINDISKQYHQWRN